VKPGPARLRIERCGPEAAPEVHRLTQQAFKDYGRLTPPSGAMRETEETVRADLARGGGALARIGPRAIGCLRLEPGAGYLSVRRLAVDPAWQRQGVGRALMAWSVEYAKAEGYVEVRVGVRTQLPGNLRFYEGLGYTVIAEHRHAGYAEVTWLEMRRGV
jgi:tRNA threonylcarbamoyladenosine biosynthesis protein TsaE